MAYGLVEGLTSLIKSIADKSTKEALMNLSQELDEKEKDAYESGFRRGIRSKMLKEISDNTRDFITQNEILSKNFDRNSQVCESNQKLERTTGLLEVNLKEDTALEDFFLSSLRIWSGK